MGYTLNVCSQDHSHVIKFVNLGIHSLKYLAPTKRHSIQSLRRAYG